MFALALQAAESGLTLDEIVLDLPHDFSAVVVYLIVGLFVFFIWYASRPAVIERYGATYDDIEMRATHPHDAPLALSAPNVARGEAKSPDGLHSARHPTKRRSRDAKRILWIG